MFSVWIKWTSIYSSPLHKWPLFLSTVVRQTGKMGNGMKQWEATTLEQGEQGASTRQTPCRCCIPHRARKHTETSVHSVSPLLLSVWRLNQISLNYQKAMLAPPLRIPVAFYQVVGQKNRSSQIYLRTSQPSLYSDLVRAPCQCSNTTPWSSQRGNKRIWRYYLQPTTWKTHNKRGSHIYCTWTSC